MGSENEHLRNTRWSLISRIKDLEDHDSWQDFFDTYWRLIYGVAVRAGLRDTEAQEVVQNTVIYVSSHIGDFKTDSESGSFKAWLLMVTRWKIGDQHKKRKANREAANVLPDGESKTNLMAGLPDLSRSALDELWDVEWAKNLTELALERLKSKVKARHYQVFTLLTLEEMSPREVAKTLEISIGQIYLIRHRLTRLLKEELVSLTAMAEQARPS